jgi:hypothetical protein
VQNLGQNLHWSVRRLRLAAVGGGPERESGAVRGRERTRNRSTAILNQYNIKWANLSSADKENSSTFKRERDLELGGSERAEM